MSQEASATTQHALLGLLSFAGEASGYELKQLADRTLRYFWVAPAMSQVYSELARMARRGLVAARAVPSGRGGRETRRYSLTGKGREALARWLSTTEVEFPVIKHGVALRLFLGHMAEDSDIEVVLGRYLDQLAARVEELGEIRRGLGDAPRGRYAAMVAEWGQRYYREEMAVASEMAGRLAGEAPVATEAAE